MRQLVVRITFSITVFSCMAGAFLASAMTFTPQTLKWRTYSKQYEDLLIERDSRSYYLLKAPDDWEIKYSGPAKYILLPPLELSEGSLELDRGGDYPSFQEKEDLEQYARILVGKLPQEATDRGKITRLGSFITFEDWKSESMKVEFSYQGRRMAVAMGFINDPENPDFQLRWTLNSRAEDLDDLIAAMNTPWSNWHYISIEDKERMENSDAIID